MGVISASAMQELVTTARTDYHGGELEALAHALCANLVWKACETNIAHEGLPNDGGGGLIGALLRERGTGIVWFVCAVGRERVAVDGGNVRVRHLSKTRRIKLDKERKKDL